MMREMIVDVFAGGGGASLGIRTALGVGPDLAINHDPDAILMHKINHPEAEHGCADVWSVDPMVATGGRPVGLAWFSPDCTHFSRAKGGKPVEKKIRSLAWVVVRWAKAVRPRVIILENVPEFRGWGPLGKNNLPDKARAGTTYNLWCNQLRGLGYKLESRELRACDYGAPTIRKRLFVIARCDGQPIVWPEPTHGPSGGLFRLKPYRTVAECIDWSIPCPSIFERKRPLAEKTLRRIARGIQKYVIDAQEPFIVRCAHGEGANGRWGRGEHSLREPLPTLTGSKDFALVSPTLIQTGYGERQGQQPRCPGLDQPLGTAVATGKHALVATFLQKYFGGVVGADVREPAPTVTAVDHNSLVVSHLTKFYGTTTGSDLREPMPTITGGGQHIGEVRAFLLKYYSTAVGQDCRKPLHTVTAKHRMGLVMVQGCPYQIADIGLRMLSPRELARAQGFPNSYVLTGTKSNQVVKIGNSVCPPVACALVRANVKLKECAASVAV
jgi:DNA (cytosine-5)-methyltransferase 1